MAIKPTVNGLIRTTVFMSAVEKTTLKKLARKRGVSYATLLREAISAFVGSATAPYTFKTATK